MHVIYTSLSQVAVEPVLSVCFFMIKSDFTGAG